ncbi:UL36 very large tegument protein [Streptomyces sp. NPDC048018]|uniref:UL36 very large tegument protein n=1 Tax=Streptomyces sp. NPDC048018 TaxID=3365499 RepID=UPI0037139DC3
MRVHQLPAEVAAFTAWLGGLAGRLDPDEGWYGVFVTRDPQGMRACLDGTDILPWDVVESLLHDLAEPPDGPVAARGRALYEAASAAHDRTPGGAAALAERRELMRHEARHAEARIRELGASPRFADERAWAQDDLARARAREAELAARLARLAAAAGSPAPRPADAAAPPGPPPRRRPRGARYAWLEAPETLPAPEPPPAPGGTPVPAAAPRGARFAPPPPAAPAAPPRGARFPATATTPAPARPTQPAAAPGQAARAAGNAVYALRRLRAQGRSGEAHALLCEALAGPPAWLPALAAELHAAGLGADWATLLWEAASLPPARLAAVAGALADAGRPYDCDQLLRQGVARPIGELAGACAALHAEGHHAEVRALLTAFLRARTPEEAARLAGTDPDALTPPLLAAARAVSPARERDLVHALRVSGLG